MRPFDVGKYRAVEILGRGPLGKIYEAIDTETNTRCALRAFAKPKGVNEERWRLAVERFSRELQPALALSHPNIGAVYEFWEQDDVYVIRSEYFKAKNIRQMIDAQVRIDVGRTVQVAKAVCQALDFAHERGLVHSDIQPYNILWVAGQLVKVINFGLGHTRPKEDSPYRAPEKVLGQDEDARSDLYSLGVVLYEMLSGVNPFLEADAKATGEAIVHRPVEPIRDVPASLNRVLGRLLAKDPAQRYQTAKDVLRALETGEAEAVSSEGHAVAAVFKSQPQESAPALSDFRQLRWSDLRAYRRRLADEETRRILRRRAIVGWTTRVVIMLAILGALAWDTRRGGPTTAVIERIGRLRPGAGVKALVDFIPNTQKQVEGKTALEALARELEMAAAAGSYPESLNCETLEQLALDPEHVKRLLTPFFGHRLSSYDRTAAGYRISVRLDDEEQTALVLENGRVKAPGK